MNVLDATEHYWGPALLASLFGLLAGSFAMLAGHLTGWTWAAWSFGTVGGLVTFSTTWWRFHRSWTGAAGR